MSMILSAGRRGLSLLDSAPSNSEVLGRASAAPAPAPAGKSKVSRTQIIAVLIIALVAFAAVAYYALNRPSSSNYYGEQVVVQIGGAVGSTPATYYPGNFTVSVGEHITLLVENTDNKTHGLAIPSFSLDTGAIKPNGTATLTFVASPAGNYTYNEPSADCGGGSCDAGQALSGWFEVQ